MRKIIIWDLCGGSQMSVPQALKNENCEIHNIDIMFNKELKHTIENTKHHLIDLTKNWRDLIQDLDKLPKPDFIFSSPMCRSFTNLVNVKKEYWATPDKPERLGIRYDNNACMYFVRNDKDEILHRTIAENKFLNHFNPQKVIKNAYNDTFLARTVWLIIQKYQPKYWYIENPESSLLFDYLIDTFSIPNYDCIYSFVLNKTYYSAYNNKEFSLKPTIFASNINLNLKKDRVKSELKRGKGCRLPQNPSKGETGKRVKIPLELIQDIYNKMCKHLEDLIDYEYDKYNNQQ